MSDSCHIKHTLDDIHDTSNELKTNNIVSETVDLSSSIIDNNKSASSATTESASSSIIGSTESAPQEVIILTEQEEKKRSFIVFHYCSDIHLEYAKSLFLKDNVIFGIFDRIGIRTILQLPPTPTNHYCALVGDIGMPDEPIYKTMLEYCANAFEHTFVIAGNHEYYNNNRPETKTMDQCKRDIREHCTNLCHKLKSSCIHFLDNEIVELPNCTIVGSTLWSNIPEIYKNAIHQSINDYQQIYVKDDSCTRRYRKITITDTNALHAASVVFINNTLNNINEQKPCVILTHHAPVMHGTSEPKYERESHISRFAFASDLDDLVEQKPNVTWIYGHTHWSVSIKVGPTRIVSNQLGYQSEANKLCYQPDAQVILYTN